MSNTARIAATAANTLVKPLDVSDVFSTYLYDGNSSTQTITNGIDLSGEGGLVWTKGRNIALYNALTDTERGGQYALYSNTTDAQVDRGSDFITSFNSNGYSIGADGLINDTYNYVSWTFRKAPKFFDVVTWTGDGTGTRDIPHNLGTTVGMIVMKQTQSTLYDWFVYHRGYTSNTGKLNSTDAFNTSSLILRPTPSQETTHFQVSGTYNGSGETHVAYLFAHNDGDGEFGSTADQDIIKCGSYTGNGSATGPEIDLGFEPQWLLFKDTTNANDWIIVDNMRGMVVDNDLANADAYLRPNSTNLEGASTLVEPTPTGFKVQNNGWTNVSGANIIYIAIRRGPMAVPESATDVFAIDTYNATPLPTFESSFVTDMALYKHSSLSQDWKAVTRLLGATRLVPNSTTAETGESDVTWDFMNGWYSNSGTASTVYSWMWKRAPNYFDVVAYTGTGSTMTINHNLGVTPEMIWTKRRDSTGSWIVYHSATGLNKYLFLNSTAAVGSAGNYYAVSDTTFGAPFVNSGGNFISYLFASLDGVSKVGSFVINNSGGTLDINCGFASGARFVLFKRSSGVGAWYVFDSERGITANADPYLELNSTNAEDTWAVMTPLSSGFTIANNGSIGSGTYIFYAIA